LGSPGGRPGLVPTKQNLRPLELLLVQQIQALECYDFSLMRTNLERARLWKKSRKLKIRLWKLLIAIFGSWL